MWVDDGICVNGWHGRHKQPTKHCFAAIAITHRMTMHALSPVPSSCVRIPSIQRETHARNLHCTLAVTYTSCRLLACLSARLPACPRIVRPTPDVPFGIVVVILANQPSTREDGRGWTNRCGTFSETNIRSLSATICI